LDLDHNILGQAIESISVTGYTAYSLTSPTDVGIVNGSFTSTVYGSGADNPTDPLSLTDEQRRKSVSFLFENVASFQATYSVTNGGTGRNFFFAGRSNIPPECARPPPSPPVPSPPSTPAQPPAQPGSTYVPVVTINVVVAGTVSDFDEEAYKNNLGATLGVNPSQISVTVAAASVRVTSVIRTANATAAEAIVEKLASPELNSTAALSAALGVTVEAIEPPTTELVAEVTDPPGGSNLPDLGNGSAPINTGSANLEAGTDDDDSSDSGAYTAVTALSIVVALLILILLVCCVISRQQWRLQLRRADPQSTQRDVADPYADMVKESWERTKSAEDGGALSGGRLPFWRRMQWRLQLRRAGGQQVKSRDEPQGYSDIVVDSWAHAIVSQPSSSTSDPDGHNKYRARSGDQPDEPHDEPDWLQDAHATAFAGPPA